MESSSFQYCEELLTTLLLFTLALTIKYIMFGKAPDPANNSDQVVPDSHDDSGPPTSPDSLSLMEDSPSEELSGPSPLPPIPMSPTPSLMDQATAQTYPSPYVPGTSLDPVIALVDELCPRPIPTVLTELTPMAPPMAPPRPRTLPIPLNPANPGLQDPRPSPFLRQVLERGEELMTQSGYIKDQEDTILTSATLPDSPELQFQFTPASTPPPITGNLQTPASPPAPLSPSRRGRLFSNSSLINHPPESPMDRTAPSPTIYGRDSDWTSGVSDGGSSTGSSMYDSFYPDLLTPPQFRGTQKVQIPALDHHFKEYNLAVHATSSNLMDEDRRYSAGLTCRIYDANRTYFLVLVPLQYEQTGEVYLLVYQVAKPTRGLPDPTDAGFKILNNPGPFKCNVGNVYQAMELGRQLTLYKLRGAVHLINILVETPGGSLESYREFHEELELRRQIQLSYLIASHYPRNLEMALSIHKHGLGTREAREYGERNLISPFDCENFTTDLPEDPYSFSNLGFTALINPAAWDKQKFEKFLGHCLLRQPQIGADLSEEGEWNSRKPPPIKRTIRQSPAKSGIDCSSSSSSLADHEIPDFVGVDLSDPPSPPPKPPTPHPHTPPPPPYNL